MEIKTGSISFPKHKGEGPRTDSEYIQFDGEVSAAVAILTGTEFGFAPYDDNHLGKVDIKIDSNFVGDTVQVIATFGVRDWSNHWDDNYQGEVYFAVLAELG